MSEDDLDVAYTVLSFCSTMASFGEWWVGEWKFDQMIEKGRNTHADIARHHLLPIYLPLNVYHGSGVSVYA
jgi:hypothetical protein